MPNSTNAPCSEIYYSLQFVLIKKLIAGASLEILQSFQNTQEQLFTL